MSEMWEPVPVRIEAPARRTQDLVLQSPALPRLQDPLHCENVPALRPEVGALSALLSDGPNHWTGKTYDPPLRVALKTALGANRWRCEYCRLNFASFRDRKEIFTFSRWRNFQT